VCRLFSSAGTFGQTSALAAGFDNASGEFILAMDGDLQHDPNDIPAFIEKLNSARVTSFSNHFVVRSITNSRPNRAGG
jgi:glycosyltransferase involved in cell wall biosynthesis